MQIFRLIFLLVTVVASMQASPIPEEIRIVIEKHAERNGWGNKYYDVLPSLIKKMNYKTVVEIGVALGGHAEAILSSTDIEKYYGIDPYLSNFDPQDQFDVDIREYSKQSGQRNYDYLYGWVQDRLAKFGERVEIIRHPSVNGAQLFDTKSLDCVFIDGDHRFHKVLEDLEAWYPKVREGGVLLGDDYWMRDVKKALNVFCKKNKLHLTFYTSSTGYIIWAIKK